MWSLPAPFSNRVCASMPVKVTLIVADVSPLITLAAAQRLDYLLYPDLPVIVPDAVFYEATRQIDKLGTQEILEWQRANSARVRIEPTEALKNEFDRLARQGGRMVKDLGERAAVEAIRNHPLAEDERAILLSDDRDVDRIVVIDPERIILLTTWDYLRQLEEAQRIQSADAVFEAARERGRHPPARELWSQHDPEIREAVRAAIERAHRDSPKRKP
jgi:hypothetical protein